MSEKALLIEECPVRGRDFEHGGEASSKIKNILKKLGINDPIIRRVSIASYEAEMNIVIYAESGKLILEIFKGKIRVTAKDKGPGIIDIKLAMKEGYSTAPPEIIEMGFGAGMGLPNIKKNSDRLKIDSKIGDGTKLVFEVDLR
jgi:anti-sigma regulatory factor (Ser/Thr protein kinase)